MGLFQFGGMLVFLTFDRNERSCFFAKNGEKKVIHDSLINWNNITFMKNVEGGLSCNKSTKAII